MTAVDPVPARVRKAEGTDRQAIVDLVIAAFGPVEGPEVVRLIADLEVDASAQPILSLVATVADRVSGHVLFSRASVETGDRELSAAILAPLAVHPEFQNAGIGGQLVMAGLRHLAATGMDLVFVLGHPDYYPRFGFAEAGVRGFDAPYPIAAKNAGAWMVLPLRPGIPGTVRGRVRCAEALNDPRYWRE